MNRSLTVNFELTDSSGNTTKFLPQDSLKALSRGFSAMGSQLDDIKTYDIDMNSRKVASLIRKFAITYKRLVTNRLISNTPMEWPSLSDFGGYLRRAYLEPAYIYDKAAQYTHFPPPIAEQLRNFIYGIRPLPHHPAAGSRGPLLLLSGNALKSISLTTEYSTSRSKRSIEFNRNFIFDTNSPYLSTHIQGGDAKVGVLTLTYSNTTSRSVLDSEKIIIIYFPIAYMSNFNGLNLGDDADVNVSTGYVTVPERNPFIITQYELEELEKLSNEVGGEYDEELEEKISELMIKKMFKKRNA